MTDDPISLDGHRSATERRETEMRRRPVNGAPSALPPPAGSLDDRLLAAPARTWVEVMEKWRFLLDLYAATPEAGDPRIRKLIDHALGEMERLRKREERT
jgi:hypothetical protein